MSFHKYESLNYVEETSHARSANPLWRFDQYNHPREIPRRRTLAKWIITFILGTTMAFTSLAMAAASTNIQGVKLWFIFNAFGTASLPTLTSIFLCFAASNLLFSLLATAIVMIAGRGVSQSTVFEVVVRNRPNTTCKNANAAIAPEPRTIVLSIGRELVNRAAGGNTLCTRVALGLVKSMR
ncbi:hypothetical protein CYMTET_35761 [Cymbomonas tetramitiformis]|uniref:Uncharacterized protein n=1 Tax=Cymbomonas tetramitiformis TaxID=36881 RepID=A0AAE0F8P8_9CHLO|nr:hypothetical protein CYMTET_35761 [Cymbomonas tetramitiformis]